MFIFGISIIFQSIGVIFILMFVIYYICGGWSENDPHRLLLCLNTSSQSVGLFGKG